jgi:hypothetical protein
MREPEFVEQLSNLATTGAKGGRGHGRPGRSAVYQDSTSSFHTTSSIRPRNARAVGDPRAELMASGPQCRLPVKWTPSMLSSR